MGLLDLINSPQFQGLLTPSDEDRKAAKMQAIAQLGFGLMGAKRGQEGQAFGRAAQGAMGAYSDRLQDLRGQNLEKLKLARWMTSADREDEQYEWQRQERQRADEQRRALDAARQAAVIPGEQAPVPMGPPDASGSTGTYQTPGGFDVNRYADSLMAINPLQALQFRQAMSKDSALGKFEPHHYTPQSVAAFQRSQNPADLVPYQKPEGTWNTLGDRGGQVIQQHSVTGELRAVGSRPPVTNINMPGLERREQQDKGAWNVKQYGDLKTLASTAQRENHLLTALERNPIDTSAATPITSTAAAWLSAAGLAGDELKAVATNAQRFNAVAKDLVLQKQLAQKGPQTESDARRLEQTVAALGNTREANAAIIKFSKAQNSRAVQQAKFYDDYWRKNRTLEGVDDAWENGPGSRSLWDDPTLQGIERSGQRSQGGRGASGSIGANPYSSMSDDEIRRRLSR